MANNARVLGIVLMHATGTSAGVFEMLKDKVCVYHGHVLLLFLMPFYGAESKKQQKRQYYVVVSSLEHFCLLFTILYPIVQYKLIFYLKLTY